MLLTAAERAVLSSGHNLIAQFSQESDFLLTYYNLLKYQNFNLLSYSDSKSCTLSSISHWKHFLLNSEAFRWLAKIRVVKIKAATFHRVGSNAACYLFLNGPWNMEGFWLVKCLFKKKLEHQTIEIVYGSYALWYF